jgi:hypothetical protein
MNTVTISGSFRKHFKQICRCVEYFENKDIRVLSPQIAEIINPNEEFAILSSDISDDPKTLQDNHFSAIDNSDMLYVCNPDGYIGLSAALEIGFALSKNKNIVFMHEPSDFTIKLYSKSINSLE